jgi:CRP-like cAMP-binding protein
LILKTINLFNSTPDEILADVAALLEEIELPSGSTIFQKGDAGDCMYIIVSGHVKVHDGDHIVNTLHDGDVFGEMAMLDPEPRLASVTALEETKLLRLDQQPFFELMEDRVEVAYGVIHVLSGRLRHLVRDVTEFSTRIQALETQLAGKGRS